MKHLSKSAHTSTVLQFLLFGLLQICSTDSPNKTLTLGYLIAWSHEWPIGPQIGSAIIPSIQEVRRRHLLDDYDIEWIMEDTYCQPKQGLLAAVKLWSQVKRLDGFIGGGCSVVCQPESLLAAAKQLPAVSYACASDTLSDKNVYPTFSRVTGLYSSLSVIFNCICETFNWKRVGIISDVVDLYFNAARDTKVAMEASGRQVIHYTLHSTVTAEADSGNMQRMRQVVKLLASQTRVILILMYPFDFRNVIIMARQEGFKAREVFFFGAENEPLLSSTSFTYHPEIGDELLEGIIDSSPSQKEGPEWDEFRQKVIDNFQNPVFDDWPHLPANASIELVESYAGKNLESDGQHPGDNLFIKLIYL